MVSTWGSSPDWGTRNPPKHYVKKELNVTYPTGFTNDSGVMRDYKILGMPTTIFIDSKGETFRHWGGILNKDLLTKVTNEMLELESAALNY